MRAAPALGIALGAAGGLGVLYALRKNTAVKKETMDAIESGGTFQARLTGYWPYVAGLSAKERLMEGGIKDRKGKPLYTLEMFKGDSYTYPYVSVAGDYEIFPYGQKILIDVWPGVTFRVVDTGGHFHGAGKLYRVAGHEPLDICVDSSATVVPKLASVTIVKGDHFDKPGKEIAASKFQGQSLVGIDTFIVG